MRWEQGRQQIMEMLNSGRLERVTPSREQAELLLMQARNHLASARLLANSDPQGGYAMAYDAARKALTSVLENQGLRTTSTRGHHVTLYEAVYTQLDPPMGKELQPFARLRIRRNETEYPSINLLSVTEIDVLEDANKAEVIVDICERVLTHMPIFVP